MLFVSETEIFSVRLLKTLRSKWSVICF